MHLTPIYKLAIALGLGLLVGVQRERAASPVAGIRTFALITVLGALAALLADRYGGWILAAGVLAVAAFVFVGNVALIYSDRPDTGITTDVATILMFCVGAAVMAGYTVEALVLGGGVAVLLQWKQPLHHFVRRIGEAEVRAWTRMTLIALVVLPALPNRGYGPYGVLNPFQIWLMVVLIVGISLVAYFAHRGLGSRGGTLMAGVLGGLVSSTATSVGYARRTHENPRLSVGGAVVIGLASAIVFARVLLEIGLVSADLLRQAAAPLLVMMAFMLALAGVIYLLSSKALTAEVEGEPPADLQPAIIFGLLYAGILLIVAAAKAQFGNRGLFVVATLSGLTEMDAITLSTAQLVNTGQLAPASAWRMILTAAMSNMVFKAGAVAVLGRRALSGRVALFFALSLLGGALILGLWP